MALQFNDGKASAVASVEGGTQDVHNVTCCICLEDLTQGGISTVTNCNHNYHLQCILEWCQRSPNCPTCRRQVSLKETESQELLEAVSHERKAKAEAVKIAPVRITRADIRSSSRSREAEFQERLNEYMASMGRRYQFAMPVDQGNTSRKPNVQAIVREQERAQVSEFQAFSDAFTSMTTRYKESISSWKVTLLAHCTSKAGS